MKLEHIGIAVKNLEKSDNLFAKLLGKENYKHEKVDSEKVVTSFFQAGDAKVELLVSENEQSAISKFIEKRGEGIHHIAFLVEDIKAEMQRLKNLGFELLNDEPKLGADNKRICFLHPRSTNGILVELCENIS